MIDLLVVQDEPSVADLIVDRLRAEGWAVAHASDGERGLALAGDHDFDVIILDLVRPTASAVDVCRTLRARRIFTPVLMLTALDALDHRLEALRVGADDCLVKPLELDELVARIAALQRRATTFAAEAPPRRLDLGPLSFDLLTLDVTLDGQKLDVTAKEREILRLLMASPGRVFSRERILSAIWGTNEDPLTNVVDVYIARLRKKCGAAACLIETVRGAGYRVRQPQSVDPRDQV